MDESRIAAQLEPAPKKLRSDKETSHNDPRQLNTITLRASQVGLKY